jgi:tetratricopeptide (TPR) repeat protein
MPARSPSPIALARCGLLVLAMSAGIAAEGPSPAEWEPVTAAIGAQAPDAGERLAAITAAYPTWPGGWIERARLDLAAKRPEAAWKHAREALTLDRTNGEAAALAVQALHQAGRAEHALSVAEYFRANRQHDKQAGGRVGWVSFYAAQAALGAPTPDPAKAEDFLKAAKTCAGAAVPGEFHFLDARLMLRKGDLAGADASLERAVAAEPRLWDAWYELGRLRAARAEAETGVPGRRALLAQAEQAFATVTRALADDYESWLGLGRTQLAQAVLESEAGGEGGAKLKDAVASLGEALARKPDLTDAWAAQGEAQLRLERWSAATEALTKARELGSTDRTLLFNLAMALEKSGQADQAAALHASTTATTAPELINKGMALAAAKRHQPAIDLLEQAAAHPDLANQPETRGQVLRFLGHAWRDWAAHEDALPADRDQRLDAAAEAYRRAGDAGDRSARGHFAALQSGREAGVAYAAGWQVLSWSGYTAPRGWALVLANYGASGAVGKPLHLAAWGTLTGIPLLLWLASLFRRVPVSSAPLPRRSGEPTSRPPAAPPPRRETDPLTARIKTPRGGPPPPAQSATPPAAKHVERPVPQRHPSPVPRKTPAPKAIRTPLPGLKTPLPGRKTPLPETEEITPPPAAAPAKRPRPR